MCNELSNKEKKALRSIPIGTNANNNQTLKYNSSTKKFEFTNAGGGGGGIGDAVLAGENNFTGQNFFANDVYIGTDSIGDDTKKVATLGNLSNLASLTANEQVFQGLDNRFEYPLFVGALVAQNELQTKEQVANTIATEISTKADTSVLANYATTASLNGYAAKAIANIFTANQTINANLAVGGTFAAAARAHFRGDGINPIARFDNNSGSNILTVSQATFGGNLNFDGITFVTNTNTLNVTSPLANTANAVGSLPTYNFTQGSDNSTVLSTSNFFRLIKIINPTAGATSFRNFILEYTINATGVQTGTATGFYLNSTETNLNGMAHNLIDLQVASSSKFSVRNDGYLITGSAIQAATFLQGNALRFTGTGRIQPASDGVFTFSNSATTSFDRIQLGGTTNSFPAIKRSGTKIDFLLADASDFCDIAAKGISANSLIRCASSTVAAASIQIPAGTAPNTPNEGDIWNSGDGRLYLRIGGATRYFSVI